jgi:hypothetical protein
MVRVNCSAIPATLIESALYGREKGRLHLRARATVAASSSRDRSTIFLDEIGDLPPDVQVKLLRVLEERRSSGWKPEADSRRHAHHRGHAPGSRQRSPTARFAKTLFYGSTCFPIQVPPLRERTEDYPLLVWRFVEEFSRTFGKPIDTIPPRRTWPGLQRYPWPGKHPRAPQRRRARDDRAARPRLTMTLPVRPRRPARRSAKLADVEKEHIQRCWTAPAWRNSRDGRRRRPPRTQADDPRNAHGQARTQAAGAGVARRSSSHRAAPRKRQLVPAGDARDSAKVPISISARMRWPS